MLEDIRDIENVQVYIKHLEEIKARLSYVSGYSKSNKDRFVIEAHALQIRKIIELIAFSLVSIHRAIYKKYRENRGGDYTKDWNGREILNNVLNINPNMFFRSLHKKYIGQQDGSKQIEMREESEYYSLKQLAKLYDRCGGILHVENPWNNSNKINSFHYELPSIVKKLQVTFLDHAILFNHWQDKQSTVLIFSLSDSEDPSCAIAQSNGNFKFDNN
ncbi:MAG: hypothetical protein EOO53_18935 [Gammaproteobacteria bacterium]|nr:MAG: hypothetical protein EOO53_18935 [Gammaproteobacteria bacterium]